jgi:hypothetical protein
LTDPGVYAAGTRTRNGRMSDLTAASVRMVRVSCIPQCWQLLSSSCEKALEGPATVLKEFAPEGIIGELRRLHYDTANATSAPTMAALTKLVPTSQITYGTDYPYFGLGQFKNLEGIGLSAVELEFIGSGNATRLIPRFQN